MERIWAGALVLVACGGSSGAGGSGAGALDAPSTTPGGYAIVGASCPHANCSLVAVDGGAEVYQNGDPTGVGIAADTPCLSACVAAGGWSVTAPTLDGGGSETVSLQTCTCDDIITWCFAAWNCK